MNDTRLVELEDRVDAALDVMGDMAKAAGEGFALVYEKLEIHKQLAEMVGAFMEAQESFNDETEAFMESFGETQELVVQQTKTLEAIAAFVETQNKLNQILVALGKDVIDAVKRVESDLDAMKVRFDVEGAADSAGNA